METEWVREEFRGARTRQVPGKKQATAVTQSLRDDRESQHHCFVHGILPGPQKNDDAENVPEILNVREKSTEYLSLS